LPALLGSFTSKLTPTGQPKNLSQHRKETILKSQVSCFNLSIKFRSE